LLAVEFASSILVIADYGRFIYIIIYTY
jgi:hypothetical protein